MNIGRATRRRCAPATKHVIRPRFQRRRVLLEPGPQTPPRQPRREPQDRPVQQTRHAARQVRTRRAAGADARRRARRRCRARRPRRAARQVRPDDEHGRRVPGALGHDGPTTPPTTAKRPNSRRPWREQYRRLRRRRHRHQRHRPSSRLPIASTRWSASSRSASRPRARRTVRLRRAASGRCARSSRAGWKSTCTATLTGAAAAFPAALAAPAYVDAVFDFMIERLRAFYRPRQRAGCGPTRFSAVAACRPTRPLDFDRRLRARDLPPPAEAESLATANKRIRNILRKVEGPAAGAVRVELLVEAPGQAPCTPRSPDWPPRSRR